MKRTIVAGALLCAALLIASKQSGAADAAPAPAASAASPSPTATPVIKRLDTEIVTAQRHPGTIGSTSRETWVLTAADIERLGAASVADALRFVPGVTVKDTGLTGSLQTVALRGAKSEQTLVLIDGRPINDPDTGAVDFSSLPVNGISRIEVVSGGASTLYGSSAIGGVINIITARPAANSSSAFIQLGYAGAVDEGVTASFNDASSLGIRVDARTTHARDQFDYPAFDALSPGTRTDTDAKIGDVAVAVSRDFGTAHARVRLSDDTQDTGIPGDASFELTPLGRQQRIFDRSDFTLDVPAGGNAWTLQLFADGRRLHVGVPVPSNPAFGFDALDNSTSRGFSVRDSISAGSAQLVTVGYDSRGDTSLFSGLTTKPPTVAADATTAWYVADDLHAPDARFSSSIGLRSERPQGTASTSVPSLGMSERLGGVTLRANYARAFRTPDLDDRYFPFAGNTALRPEYAATFDTGATADFGAGNATLTWFGVDTNNLIVFNPTTFLPVNIAKASVRGMEAQTELKLSAGAHIRFGYTDYPRAADLSALPGTRLLYRPTATGSTEYWRTLGRGSAGLSLAFTGRRYADEANTTALPAYANLSAYVSRPLGRGFGLTVRLDNITGQRVEDTFGYPVLGTTLSVRLTTSQ
ncbi:MAG TPA: TonB-dependent receptor [Candidatus Eremiobacteraceae bacterium]